MPSTKKKQPTYKGKLKSAVVTRLREPKTKREFELGAYAEAIEWFSKRKFEIAKPLFAKLASIANPEIAHAARMRVLMCEQRLNSRPGSGV